MKHFLKAALAGVVIFAGTGAALAQEGPKAEVIHWWTSGGESAAVKTFAESYSKAGGVWVDAAIAGGDNARAAAVNRMIGGNPPAAVQFNIGKQFDDLVDKGMLRNLDDIAVANKWKETLPKPVLEAITRNGHIYAAPINIHGQNWMWYSKGAFEKAGIANPPKSFDELFADLDKLKAAGVVPLALNGQVRHMALIFNSLLVSRGGHDLYVKIYKDHDEKAVNSPEFKKVVEEFGKFRGYVDAGYSSRLWNDATSMIIKNTAGVQFMGDWAKGEFNLAQKAQGKDYGCVVGPRHPELHHRRRRLHLPEKQGRQADRRSGSSCKDPADAGSTDPVQPEEGLYPVAYRRGHEGLRPMRPGCRGLYQEPGQPAAGLRPRHAAGCRRQHPGPDRRILHRSEVHARRFRRAFCGCHFRGRLIRRGCRRETKPAGHPCLPSKRAYIEAR